MSSDSSTPVPEPGLPPVAPPSGRFIAQLFLVPGAIVFLAVLLLLMFRYLFGSGYTPEQFLRQLDNGNAEIRWRGASDLAQVLEKNESLPLRADTGFALALVSRLQTALADLDKEEKNLAPTVAKTPEKDRDLVWRKLKAQRDYISFLVAASARFHAPVAIGVLSDLAQRSGSPNIKGQTLLRRQALWALGILGDNTQKFAKLPQENQTAILAQLSQEAQGSDPGKSTWARTALFYLDKARLEKVPEGKQGIVEVDKVLAKCAEVDDPYARELVALTLRFWDGPLVEPTVIKLAHDDGHGQLLAITELD